MLDRVAVDHRDVRARPVVGQFRSPKALRARIARLGHGLVRLRIGGHARRCAFLHLVRQHAIVAVAFFKQHWLVECPDGHGFLQFICGQWFLRGGRQAECQA